MVTAKDLGRESVGEQVGLAFLDAVLPLPSGAQQKSSYKACVAHCRVDNEVTTMRGLDLSRVCWALATTRRERRQLLQT